MFNENQPFSFGSKNDNFESSINYPSGNDFSNSTENNIFGSDNDVGLPSSGSFNLDNFGQKFAASDNNIFDTEVSGVYDDKVAPNESAGIVSPNQENTMYEFSGSNEETKVPETPVEAPALPSKAPIESEIVASVPEETKVPSVTYEAPALPSGVSVESEAVASVPDETEVPETPVEAPALPSEVPVESEIVASVPEETEVPETPVEAPVLPSEAPVESEIVASVPEETEVPETPVLSSEVPVESEAAEEPQIEMSDTPIEEIEKLTQYEPDNIETTDINALFDRVSVNFKDASDIFKRNTEMKQKIDSRFAELKALQDELNSQKQNQIVEINAYKDEVFNKLTDKKEEIEKRLNMLKEMQSNIEKEKETFEKYKKDEMENIENIKKQVQEAYDERREELNHVEDLLRKQKDSLDEERNQLSLDKIEYESNKNELANNLLKFNELVDSFTNGVGNIVEEGKK